MEVLFNKDINIENKKLSLIKTHDADSHSKGEIISFLDILQQNFKMSHGQNLMDNMLHTKVLNNNTPQKLNLPEDKFSHYNSNTKEKDTAYQDQHVKNEFNVKMNKIPEENKTSASEKTTQNENSEIRSDKPLNNNSQNHVNKDISAKSNEGTKNNFDHLQGEKNLEKLLQKELGKHQGEFKKSENIETVDLKEIKDLIDKKKNPSDMENKIEAKTILPDKNDKKDLMDTFLREDLNKNKILVQDKILKKRHHKNVKNPLDPIHSMDIKENSILVSRETNHSPHKIFNARYSTDSVSDMKSTLKEKTQSIYSGEAKFARNDSINNSNLSKIMESPILKYRFNDQFNSLMSRARMIIRNQENASLSANLYPKELGKIYLRLSLVEGSLNGSFTVENDVVQKMLSDRMGTIMNGLKEEGYLVSGFKVDIQSNTSTNENFQKYNSSKQYLSDNKVDPDRINSEEQNEQRSRKIYA